MRLKKQILLFTIFDTLTIESQKVKILNFLINYFQFKIFIFLIVYLYLIYKKVVKTFDFDFLSIVTK